MALKHQLKTNLTLSAIALVALGWMSLPLLQPSWTNDNRAALVHALTTINTFPEERLLTSQDQPSFCGTPLLAAEYVAEKLTGLDADAVRELAADPSRYYTVPIGSM